MKKCLSAVLLTAAILLNTVPVMAYSSDCLVPQKNADSASFVDTAGIWCASYVQTCYETGLIEGFTKTTFKPNQSLTCAQILVITARLHSFLHGGDGQFAAAKSNESWYAPYYTYLKKAGVAMQFPFDNADLSGYASDACTRWNFVGLLDAVLPDSVFRPINSVSVIPDVEPSPTLLKFYNAGILNGTDAYGNFRGDLTLTRGQASAFLARIVDPSQRLTFTLTPFDLCRDILKIAPETVLLKVDNTDVTAEQFAYLLVSCLTEGQGTLTLAEAEDKALWQCEYALAIRQLAVQHGITLSEEEMEKARQSAQNNAGSFGITENGWLWRTERSELEKKVRIFYVAHYGGDESAHMAEPANWWNDINRAIDTMAATKTPDYQALDLSAIRTQIFEEDAAT